MASHVYIYLHFPSFSYFIFSMLLIPRSHFSPSPCGLAVSPFALKEHPHPPPPAVVWAFVLISAQDSRGVTFTLAINPFQPVNASLPIGYSLTWLPAGVRNIWFGVTTAISSGLAVRCVPPPKVHCVEMSIPPSSPTFFSQ